MLTIKQTVSVLIISSIIPFAQARTTPSSKQAFDHKKTFLLTVVLDSNGEALCYGDIDPSVSTELPKCNETDELMAIANGKHFLTYGNQVAMIGTTYIGALFVGCATGFVGSVGGLSWNNAGQSPSIPLGVAGSGITIFAGTLTAAMTAAHTDASGHAATAAIGGVVCSGAVLSFAAWYYSNDTKHRFDDDNYFDDDRNDRALHPGKYR